MIKKKEIYFVYNAKGGKWNYIVDTIHKYASPSTYECNLCQITHDLKMRKTWKDFVEKTPHQLHFLHSEELNDFGLENHTIRGICRNESCISVFMSHYIFRCISLKRIVK